MRAAGGGARVVGVLLIVVFAALGIVLGVLESFSYPWRLAGVPVGVLGAAVANLLAAQLAGRGTRSRPYAAVPGVAWLLTAMVLSVQRPEGDFVVLSSWLGYGYLLAGTVGAVAGIVLTPWRHAYRDRE
ncbi:MAG: DUF6113 family protein [Streptosporangiales bacterium]